MLIGADPCSFVLKPLRGSLVSLTSNHEFVPAYGNADFRIGSVHANQSQQLLCGSVNSRTLTT